MSEQASVTPLSADARRPRGGEGVVVPLSETVQPQARPSESKSLPADAKAAASGKPAAAADKAAPTEAAQPPLAVMAAPRKRGGRWLPVFCALLAVLAAAVALAAPGLRPQIAGAADSWMGRGNLVSSLLAPPAELDAGWRQARSEAMQAVNAHLADYTARLDRLAAAQQATTGDVARALADLRTERTTSEALSRAVDDLTRQAKDLRTATSAVDGRVRATGLLTMALRLRRDLDAGMPIGRDVAALLGAGPYPPAIDRSLQQLRRINDSAPTMHELAEELDRVVARLTARADAGASWTNRGWSRLAGMFGGSGTAGGAGASGGIIDRLRGLAAEGRFSEAADELQASSDADLGAEWVARVRARATAVVATQALLGYSLAAYENAFAPGSDVGGRLTQ
jgi:hypothetical protein